MGVDWSRWVNFLDLDADPTAEDGEIRVLPDDKAEEGEVVSLDSCYKSNGEDLRDQHGMVNLIDQDENKSAEKGR